MGFTGFDSSFPPPPPPPTTKLIILLASDALRFFPCPPASDPALSGVISRLCGVASLLLPCDGEGMVGVVRLGMLNLVSPPQSGEMGGGDFSVLKLWETLDLVFVGVVTTEEC